MGRGDINREFLMTKYKIRKDYYKSSGKHSHRKVDFYTLFRRILKLMQEQNLMITKYENDDKFVYIQLAPK